MTLHHPLGILLLAAATTIASVTTWTLWCIIAESEVHRLKSDDWKIDPSLPRPWWACTWRPK